MRTLDIVIVNRNSGAFLSHCIASVEASILQETVLRSVTVVDNASTDGSAEELHCSLPLTVLKSDRNLGFGCACNQGARNGGADYLLFLNPDITLFAHTLEHAVDALSEVSKAGLLGIRLIGSRNELQASKMVFPQPQHLYNRSFGLSRLFPKRFPSHFYADQNANGTADCVLGAFMLLKRCAFESVCGFDEAFFLYFEEIDLAKRLFLLGWKCLYRADIVATHTGACGEGTLVPFRIEQSIRSRLLYAKRYFSFASYKRLRRFTLTIEPILRAAYALFLRKHPVAVLRAYYHAAKVKVNERTRTMG